MNTKINFDLNKVKTLSPADAKKYIDDYFIPLTDGTHAFYVNGSYEIYDTTIIKNTYFKRMSTELNKYYFNEKTDLKTTTYDINQPTFYENFLNLCPKIKQSHTPYQDFTKEIKNKVEIMLNHINEVLCSNNNESYEFILKWFSNMIKGSRNNSCLYLKGPQGAGKSTPLEFLREHVIGNALCFQGGSGPLKTKFNSELSGKLMVVFEELENFSSSEWISISSVLKRQITSPTLMIEAKGKDAKEQKNLNNYILVSNNDAIQDDDGRRYFILDINAKYTKNEEYFNKIYACFDDEVGKAFYSYLYEIDTQKFNPQSYPMTNSKLDSFSKRLDNVYKFLKNEYVLKNRGIKQTVSQLHEEYVAFCLTIGTNKPKGKIDFNNMLKNIGIEYSKSHGQNIYKVTMEELKQISNKFNWVHELDEMKEETETTNNNPELDGKDFKTLYEELLKENQKLKEQLNKKEVKEEIKMEELDDLEKDLMEIQTKPKKAKVSRVNLTLEL